MKFLMSVALLALVACAVYAAEEDVNAKRDKRGLLASYAALPAAYAAYPAAYAYAPGVAAPLAYSAAAPYVAAPAYASPFAAKVVAPYTYLG